MDWYLVKQLSLFFLFSVGLLSSVGVAIGTVSDLAYKITEYKLPISVAILVFGYKVPEYVAYALPISMLMTNLIIYGRLASDRELVALRSFGISFYRLVTPVLVFGLIVTLITFWFNESIVPAANYQANLIQNPFIAETELNLQKKDLFYSEYEPSNLVPASNRLKTIYFAEQYQQQKLQGITIINLNQGEISQIVTAKLAQWNQQQQVWDLFEGEINTVTKNFPAIISQHFSQTQLPLAKTIFEIAEKERSPEDMNISQAKEYLNLIQYSAKKTEIAKFKVRIQQKYAFPFICLVFALVGATLGAKYTEINRSKGFGLGVGIVFIYYLLAFAIGSLGITGVISPFWAAWTPNLIGFIIGTYLLVSVNKLN